MSEPSRNGRAKSGRFAKGNKGGPGNPHADSVAKLRSTMMKAVTPAKMKAVVAKLIELAETGDIKAIDLLLNRVLGKIQDPPAVAVQGMTDAERQAKTAAIVARHCGRTPNQIFEARKAGISPGAGLAAEVVARLRSERADADDAADVAEAC